MASTAIVLNPNSLSSGPTSPGAERSAFSHHPSSSSHHNQYLQFSTKKYCNRDVVAVCVGVIILQFVAASGAFGCVLAVTSHAAFVCFMLYQNRSHSILASESPSISRPARIQRCLRVWLGAFVAAQYLVYQCIVMSFREIYLLENVLVFIFLLFAAYFAFQVTSFRGSFDDNMPMPSPRFVLSDFNEGDGFGLLHPHDCVWLGARVPSSGPVARAHTLSHVFLITAGGYAAHQTATAVCTPIMIADFFLFPAQCQFAFADFQMALSFSALILTSMALALSVFLLVCRFVWIRLILAPAVLVRSCFRRSSTVRSPRSPFRR